MGIGASVFLIAVGAILAFAVEFESRGIDINAVGVILMLLGIVGLLLSLVFWSSWVSPRRRVVSREPDVVYDREVTRRPVVRGRRVVRESQYVDDEIV